MIRRAAPGAFRANLAQGGHGEIVTGQYPEAERLAERISHILKIDICGVDLLFSGSGFVVCEVNNNPGFSKVRVRVPCRAVRVHPALDCVAVRVFEGHCTHRTGLLYVY